MSDLMELVNGCGEAAQEKGDVEAAIREANALKELGFDTAAAEIMRRATLKGKLNRIAEHKYVVITDEKIRAFLERKAKARPAPEPRMIDRFDRFIRDHAMREKRLPSDFEWQSMSTTISDSFARQIEEDAQRSQARGLQNMVSRSISMFGDSVWGGATQTSTARIGVSGGQGYMWTWKEVPVSEYKAVPPKDVLLKLAEHRARGCFDGFTIASVEKIKDPLLLGRVDGVSDRRFYVAQWGEDVALDDVI